METIRTAYLLTTNPTSERTLFSHQVLSQVGFRVVLVPHIPHEDKVVSNKISMQNIYRMIHEGEEEYAYVFEDDINLLEPISLQEIVEYESVSPVFVYLGVCCYHKLKATRIHPDIAGHPVITVAGGVRGLHAIGLSKAGAQNLLEFSHGFPDEPYMDVILENFSIQHPANVVRFDLQSYIPGHRGVFFQDRRRFPSTI
jgi:hypothetical protein